MCKEAAAVVGTDGVVIDSFSHTHGTTKAACWISRNAYPQCPVKTSYTAWNEGRAKKAKQLSQYNTRCRLPHDYYITVKDGLHIEENDKGKMEPTKVGLAPVQSETIPNTSLILFYWTLPETI